jgi:hypothetical protein
MLEPNMTVQENDVSQSNFPYEKPTAIVLGDASELILGGGKYGQDCCSCYKYT